jgi:hypothetical protein
MANTYTLIEAKTLGSSAASVEFTSIPQTYTDLLIKLSTRNTSTNVANSILMALNGSSTSFTIRRIEGTGTSVGSQNSTSNFAGVDDGGGATASTFSNTEIYIPNYAGSNYKSYSVDSVSETNAATIYMHLLAGLWSNSAAITSIALSDDTANLAQYSTFYLYGIKNS